MDPSVAITTIQTSEDPKTVVVLPQIMATQIAAGVPNPSMDTIPHVLSRQGPDHQTGRLLIGAGQDRHPR